MHGSYDITDRKRHSTKKLYSPSCFSVVVCLLTRCFEGTYRLHVQGSVHELPHNPEASSKRREEIKQSHGATTHANRFVNRHPMKASNRCLRSAKNVYIISYYFNIIVYCVVFMHD